MKVLICCDYSEIAREVLNQAAKFLAAYPDAELYLFNALDVAAVSVASMYNNTGELGTLEKEAKQIEQWGKQAFNGRNISFSTEVGYPSQTILNKISSLAPDLVVIGTHGRTGVGRLLIGSVAESVLRHISCATLVIPVKGTKHGQDTRA